MEFIFLKPYHDCDWLDMFRPDLSELVRAYGERMVLTIFKGKFDRDLLRKVDAERILAS
jgi:hypothetical protein